MRAVQYVDQETGTAVGEVPDPAPGPDDVIVAVEACGLCGSDVHSVHSGRAKPGQILGHEFSGRISALGSNVTGWAQGQAVAASPIGSCGQCLACAKGLPFRCPNVPNIGISVPGAYAQYVKVPARQLVALPGELPIDVGSHAEPLSVGSQAVKLANVGPGDPVLVYGVGPIGLYAIMALKLAGAGPIVAAGRSAGRRQAAADVGADVVIDTREISVAEYAEQSGTQFAAVLECSAAPGAFNEALSVTAPGGTVVEVALTQEEADGPAVRHPVGRPAHRRGLRVHRRDLPGVGRAPGRGPGAGGAPGLRTGVAGRHPRRAAPAPDAGDAGQDPVPPMGVKQVVTHR